MTLAAAFILDQVPIVMADMLVSLASGPEQPGLQLPSSGPVSNLPEGRPPLHGLRQKVTVIAENFAVAFADDVGSAMIIIAGLRRLAAKVPLTHAVLKEFAQRNVERFSKVALVGFLIDRNEEGLLTVMRVQWRGRSFHLGVLGEVDVAGSGAALLQIASGMFERPAFESSAPSTKRALTTALSLCGVLLREEHATGSTIATVASGGSYELAYFDGRKFVKFPDVTFIVWDVNVVGDAVDIKLPYLVLRQIYVKHVAVLNVARAQGGPNREDFKYVCHTHLVPEAHRALPDIRRVEPDKLGFNSTTTVHSILISQGDTAHVTTILEIGKSLFQADETPDGRFTSQCDPALLKSIQKVALEH